MNEYWNSDEGRKVANGMGKVGVSIFGATTGLKDPTGSVSETAGKTAEIVVPYAADASQKLMANVHETYKTEADKFRSEHFIKDSESNFITAEEFAEKGKVDIAEQLKQKSDREVSRLQDKAAKEYSLQEKAYQKGEIEVAQEHQREGDRLMQELKQKEKEYQNDLQELYSKKHQN